ncbi:hypothetical protein ALQ03_103181 [Pseudomonas savastanoi pv. glycinea]|nr:hypothetical protein ALQ75_103692 [Pseudomonas savastanoi pv. glycinea]RMM96801.1 hypothetical protein ALQ69_104010 [Pseudomonas savastanoi pv. glycinea]RMP97653.1 hypothetical protein ALQ13_103174 [Pseudomonas savastanoi pv. glycinea]RMQ48680.1 hypothetical protein ALQ03_103181 [Pseudomonas savastanoi pv. glycinea]RMR39625.1 hypothetical protein ALP88_103705 [Pseudomonas savastanoi pv. glycinea]
MRFCGCPQLNPDTRKIASFVKSWMSSISTTGILSYESSS